jgi:hypothetical protein
LHKRGHGSQASVVDQILATVGPPTPDYKSLAGIEMWEGRAQSGRASHTSGTSGEDESALCQTITEIAATMDRLEVERSGLETIAKTFREWLDRGIV